MFLLQSGLLPESTGQGYSGDISSLLSSHWPGRAYPFPLAQGLLSGPQRGAREAHTHRAPPVQVR